MDQEKVQESLENGATNEASKCKCVLTEYFSGIQPPTPCRFTATGDDNLCDRCRTHNHLPAFTKSE
jgi:hypothetical protein